MIGERPIGFPEIELPSGRAVRGIEVVPGAGLGAGTLHVQCIVRGFSSGQKPVEALGSVSRAMTTEEAERRVGIPVQVDLDTAAFEHVRAEIWLSWTGKQPLALTAPPEILDDR